MQTALTVLIVLGALAYVLRSWLPIGRRALMHHTTAPAPAATAGPATAGGCTACSACSGCGKG